jgi:hypothetical protein
MTSLLILKFVQQKRASSDDGLKMIWKELLIIILYDIHRSVLGFFIDSVNILS